MNGLTKDMATEFETPLQMEGALAQAEQLAIPVGVSVREGVKHSLTPALWWRKGRLEARAGRFGDGRGSPRWVDQPEFLQRMSNLARSRTRKRNKQRAKE